MKGLTVEKPVKEILEDNGAKDIENYTIEDSEIYDFSARNLSQEELLELANATDAQSIIQYKGEDRYSLSYKL